MRFGRFCKCGHPKDEHFTWNRLIKGSTEYRGSCLHDSVVIGAWRYPGCDCKKYVAKHWPLIHFYKGRSVAKRY